MAGTRIGIVGAGGRMGRMLLEAALKDEGVTLGGAFDVPGSTAIGQTVAQLTGLPSDIKVSDDLAGGRSTFVSRLWVHGVIEAPGGAGMTAMFPDYPLDLEAVMRYQRMAADADWRHACSIVEYPCSVTYRASAPWRSRISTSSASAMVAA